MGDVIEHIKNEVMRMVNEYDVSHTDYYKLIKRLSKELVEDIKDMK